MNIIEFDYNKNEKRILNKLAELAAEQSSEDFQEIDDDIEEKEDKKISLAYVEDDQYLGGIVGHIEYPYNFLKIDWFAVEKEARGKGVGTQLIKEIEEIATKEGCSTAFVETISFSAPDFYEKQGYSVLGKLNDFPMKGIANYWFYKRLSEN